MHLSYPASAKQLNNDGQKVDLLPNNLVDGISLDKTIGAAFVAIITSTQGISIDESAANNTLIVWYEWDAENKLKHDFDESIIIETP